MIHNNDKKWMEAALEWASKGKGWNSPRPSVGCVLVKDGEIIGAGHTQRGDGNPHAEVIAMRTAKDAQKSTFGATAYVTLEPCSHYGTTPPCSKALIEAGIKRVVVGVGDPNPEVNGNGIQQMRDAGIEVVTNFMALECVRHDEHFLKQISTSTPFVTLKSAVSLDGKTALPNGESQWITGEAARQNVHYLRHCHDAVMVGSGTAIADNPQLSVRLEGKYSQPARVVVDSRGAISADLRLFDKSTFDVPVYVATTEQISNQKREELENRGAKVLLLPQQNGKVAVKVLLQQLYEFGIYSILVEGGATLGGALLQRNLVDKIVCYVAPKIIGEGIGMTRGFQLDSLGEAAQLHYTKYDQFGEDIKVSGYLGDWAAEVRELINQKM